MQEGKGISTIEPFKMFLMIQKKKKIEIQQTDL